MSEILIVIGLFVCAFTDECTFLDGEEQQAQEEQTQPREL